MKPPKPFPVVVSENLLWSTIVIAVMIVGIDYEHMQAVLDTSNAKRHVHVSILMVVAVMLVIQVCLIALIFAGKRWGRTLFMISFVLGLPAVFPAIQEEWHRSVILSGLTVIQTLIQLLSLALLFSGEAQTWFDDCRRG